MKAYTKAKPFIKWVGGKGQLLEQLDENGTPNILTRNYQI